MVRLGLSILAAIGLAFACVVLVELFSAVVHPFPEGFTSTQEEMCRHVERYPHWVLAVVVVAWWGTAFVSVFAARRLGNRASGLVVSGLLFSALAFNVLMLPYPMWFKAATLATFPLASIAAIRTPERPVV
ncbi:MAG: hypothetical protein AB7U20_12970 [Planctomycetaceae bacterium]